LPELAVLGLGGTDDIRPLREQLLGTPITTGVNQPAALDLGGICGRTLKTISEHSSKASAAYYLNFFKKYFNALNRSLSEVCRVLSKNGKAVIVVQDSYYKEIHIDLASIISEVMHGHGMALINRNDFSVKNIMAHVNSKSRKYINKRVCVSIF